MALRLKLFQLLAPKTMRHYVTSSSIPNEFNIKTKKYKTNDFITLEDPDTFGTLSGGKTIKDNVVLEDEGDIKEQKFLENAPLPSQKFTIKQYADIIKQYLEHRRLKEAIDVLEVRMLTQDRVQPVNYIYNILIGACADVGYTKKAFKLFNDMKRRALKPTGDTYTCLFEACVNSPWPKDGLKNAHHLKALMEEKGIEPNLTNYNTMIKAFGRCGDLPMAFKIVDEMVAKKIKIRVHTFNHLLHACITDKSIGLRHALVVWRKMLKMREKPNIYSFNLMLKCVKECDLGSKEDIEELLSIIVEQMALENSKNVLPIAPAPEATHSIEEANKLLPVTNNKSKLHVENYDIANTQNIVGSKRNNESSTELVSVNNKDNISFELVDKIHTIAPKMDVRTVPNFLSKHLRIEAIMSIKEVHSLQDKFAVIGGQEDFIKEMEQYALTPDIKVFTQMLPLIEDTHEAEGKLLETMKTKGVKADIDFYNMLIKKRCLRSDYEGAFDVKNIIEQDSKKRHPLNKKHRLKVNIMTYGVLAMACKTKADAEKLLNEMNEEKFKVNIEILGALLRQGISTFNFGYIFFIMEIVKSENIKVNDVFIKHLEEFNEKCENNTKQDNPKTTNNFLKSYQKYLSYYKKWLQDVDVKEALTPVHPWKQFREPYPETMQRSNFEIKEPKKFFKRTRKFVPYVPKI